VVSNKSRKPVWHVVQAVKLAEEVSEVFENLLNLNLKMGRIKVCSLNRAVLLNPAFSLPFFLVEGLKTATGNYVLAGRVAMFVLSFSEPLAGLRAG
jgi:hypothetical protein